MPTVTATGKCGACRRSGLELATPSPVVYPGALYVPVCADCDPLHPLELGAAALEDPSPAERAAAESVWRAVLDPDQPCRCSGAGRDAEGKALPCDHGDRCCDNGCGDEGRYLHMDRVGCGLLSGTNYWLDVYACTACTSTYSQEVLLPDLPWGELTQSEGGGSSYSLYKGARHMNFSNDGE